MRNSLITISILIIFSCSNKIKNNDKYEQVIDTIVKYYDGSIFVSKIVELGSTSSRDIIEVSVENSSTIKDYKDVSLPSSNIAFLLYNNLEKQYDIKVILKDVSSKRLYSKDDLDIMYKSNKVFKKLLNILIIGDEKKLMNLIDNSKENYNKSEFVERLFSLEKKNSSITEGNLLGFKFDRDNRYSYVFGLLSRKNNIKSKIFLKIDYDNQKIKLINYNW